MTKLARPAGPGDPYRTLLEQPGRLVLDRCFLSELVYGPLHRGRSRLSWAQALDLAEAVTRRDGLFLHLTAPTHVIHACLRARDGSAPDPAELEELITAYHRVFQTVGAYAPVLTLDTAGDELSSAE
ncbi:hypothetical protein [Streptomyces specialis]|uniref:hypothetical protein n=1 Tax=Streptomyces specialis TaxID=498367 RepID=UPI00073E8708|nr:hypothetical protein [Streptomyces specialis]